ncbi:MAG: hypothetical protein U0944_00060, partial [Candidatus Moranbacteria bacterium]|nr:hypothetical protein [Candidatus Moranbacteria bacterium]
FLAGLGAGFPFRRGALGAGVRANKFFGNGYFLFNERLDYAAFFRRPFAYQINRRFGMGLAFIFADGLGSECFWAGAELGRAFPKQGFQRRRLLEQRGIRGGIFSDDTLSFFANFIRRPEMDRGNFIFAFFAFDICG